MEETKNEIMKSRRQTLKRAGKLAAFVVPTMVTFQATSLKVAASTGRGRGHGDGHGNGNDGNFPGGGHTGGNFPGGGNTGGNFPGGCKH
jgi:hypothetical protein